MFRKEDIVFILLTLGIAIVLSMLLGGCCRYCKIDKPPALVEEVPIPCKLPEGPGELPIPVRAEKCLEKHVCYDIENSAKLAARDGKLKQWIREAKAKCGAKDD